MYIRTLAEKIATSFKNGFITVLYGPRRVGKTVLLEQVKAQLKDANILLFNGDTSEAVNALDTNSEVRLTELVKNHNTIFIDEAQKIPNISLALKIIIDKFPEKKIVVTGSSSLALARGAKENLTGRTQVFTLFPLSTTELTAHLPTFQKHAFLDNQLVFGGYPHVYSLSTAEEKKRYLANIVEQYLFQDVLLLERVTYPEGFKKLATLLAFQVGSVVSQNELANSLDISVKTVARYIDLLEKSFVIFELGTYSTNLRKEVSKNKKYYFYDIGIRNALINQFQSLTERVDVGQLWKNFVILERMRLHAYAGRIVSQYFWKNYSGTEIDLLEMEDGVLSAFECKWAKSTAKTPQSFRDKYKIKSQIINRENYLDFILQ